MAGNLLSGVVNRVLQSAEKRKNLQKKALSFEEEDDKFVDSRPRLTSQSSFDLDTLEEEVMAPESNSVNDDEKSLTEDELVEQLERSTRFRPVLTRPVLVPPTGNNRPGRLSYGGRSTTSAASEGGRSSVMMMNKEAQKELNLKDIPVDPPGWFQKFVFHQNMALASGFSLTLTSCISENIQMFILAEAGVYASKVQDLSVEEIEEVLINWFKDQNRGPVIDGVVMKLIRSRVKLDTALWFINAKTAVLSAKLQLSSTLREVGISEPELYFRETKSDLGKDICKHIASKDFTDVVPIHEFNVWQRGRNDKIELRSNPYALFQELINGIDHLAASCGNYSTSGRAKEDFEKKKESWKNKSSKNQGKSHNNGGKNGGSKGKILVPDKAKKDSGGAAKTCYICKSTEHLKSACPNRGDVKPPSSKVAASEKTSYVKSKFDGKYKKKQVSTLEVDLDVDNDVAESNMIEVEDAVDLEEFDTTGYHLQVNSVQVKGKFSTWTEELGFSVNGTEFHPLLATMDTGAAVCVISFDVLKGMLLGSATRVIKVFDLHRPLKLKGFNGGEVIKQAVLLNVGNAEDASQQDIFRFYISRETSGRVLISYQAIQELGYVMSRNVNSSGASDLVRLGLIAADSVAGSSAVDPSTIGAAAVGLPASSSINGASAVGLPASSSINGASAVGVSARSSVNGTSAGGNGARSHGVLSAGSLSSRGPEIPVANLDASVWPPPTFLLMTKPQELVRLSDKERLELETLVAEFEDIFGEELTKTDPMYVSPAVDEFTSMNIKTHRRFINEPKQVEFLRGHVNRLEKLGFIERNPYAHHACPSQLVLKPNGKYRHVVDLREINKVTKPIHIDGQDLRHSLLRINGSRFFATFDLTDGFWQLPLSGDVFNFWTNEGIYRSNRVLQGARNASAHLSIALRRVFSEMMGRGLEIYVDDILIHHKDFRGFLSLLQDFFERCRMFNVLLKPSKSCLIAASIKWCGHFISSEGYARDPRNLSSILELGIPRTAADLQKIIGMFGWMRDSIKSYTFIMKPLQDLLNLVSAEAQTKKSKKLLRFDLALSWKPVHTQALNSLKQAVQAMPLLVFPEAGKQAHLFTDASKDAWGSMLTMTRVGVNGIDASDHQVLAFRSGYFRGSQLNWSTIDKEAYAVIDALTGLEHLLVVFETPVRVYTDHRNLTAVLRPDAVAGDKVRLGKLERWSLSIQHIPYLIEYIPGPKNVWADWISRPNVLISDADVRALEGAVDDVVDIMELDLDVFDHNVYKGDLLQPTLLEIQSLHLSMSSEPCSNAVREEGTGFWYVGKALYIPNGNHKLRLRLIVLAHNLHPSPEVQYEQMRKVVFWKGMEKDIQRFCSRCYHCLISSSRTVARPLGSQLHASEPDRILHFDYLQLPAETVFGFNYLLVLKDDFTGMVELFPSTSCDAIHVANSMTEWFSRHRIARTFISDQGTHFKNKVIEALVRALGVDHHFTAPYSPWANGTIERINVDIAKLFRVLLSSKKLHEENWLSVLDLVVAHINMSPSRFRNNKSPFELFTGCAPTVTLNCLVNPFTGIVDRPLEAAQVQKYLEDLVVSLDKMHNMVFGQMEKRREQNRSLRNKNRRIVISDFQIGDTVLVARRDSVNKLQAKWLGPAVVTKVYDDGYTFDVDFNSSPPMTMTRHVSRLKLLDKAEQLSSSGVTVAMEELLNHHANARREYDKVMDIKKMANRWKCLVTYVGLDLEDAIWLPLQKVEQILPGKIQVFLGNANLPGHIVDNMDAITNALY